MQEVGESRARKGEAGREDLVSSVSDDSCKTGVALGDPRERRGRQRGGERGGAGGQTP